MPLVTVKDILQPASQGRYAVGMFDVHNLEMIKAVICAAEKEQSPVILALAQVHAPEPQILDEIGSLMLYFAHRASVPVAVHLDHASSLDFIARSLELGFSSVMYDGSTLPMEENIRNSQYVVEMARKKGASVEAELGHVGGEEGSDMMVADILYTDVGDAVNFVEHTGIDALAVSIGTVHGVYRTQPRLNLPLLLKIHESVSVPLVLHGGSGLSGCDIKNCIYNGISKINIYTELIQAAKASIDRNILSMSYPELMGESVKAMQDIAADKIRLFASNAKK